jgi:hypothetical protein
VTSHVEPFDAGTYHPVIQSTSSCSLELARKWKKEQAIISDPIRSSKVLNRLEGLGKVARILESQSISPYSIFKTSESFICMQLFHLSNQARPQKIKEQRPSPLTR